MVLRMAATDSALYQLQEAEVYASQYYKGLR